MFTALRGLGMWENERGVNPLDSGYPHYEVYECADGKWISIAPIEGRFHSELLRLIGISAQEVGEQRDPTNWGAARAVLARAFKKRTRDEWCDLLEGSDACFAPVLDMAEAPAHEHLSARETFIEIDGVPQPAPAPRFSRTVPARPTPPEEPDAMRALERWITLDEIRALQKSGVL